MAEASYRFDESIGQKGGVAGSFSVIPDTEGNPADVVFHAAGRSRALPEPSIGAYLVAGESNLPCESHKRWMAPPAVDEHAAQLDIPPLAFSVAFCVGRSSKRGRPLQEP